MAMNRILFSYKTLGRVLNNPQSYGLGDRAPKPLVEVLSAVRQSLREELEEENRLSAQDWLSAELSQDADRPKPATVKRARAAGRLRSAG